MWMSVSSSLALPTPPASTPEAPSAANARWALTWRMGARAREVMRQQKRFLSRPHHMLLFSNIHAFAFAAKTFLGTFSFDRYDASIRSIAVHDLQREIIQLVRRPRSFARLFLQHPGYMSDTNVLVFAAA